MTAIQSRHPSFKTSRDSPTAHRKQWNPLRVLHSRPFTLQAAARMYFSSPTCTSLCLHSFPPKPWVLGLPVTSVGNWPRNALTSPLCPPGEILTLPSTAHLDCRLPCDVLSSPPPRRSKYACFRCDNILCALTSPTVACGSTLFLLKSFEVRNHILVIFVPLWPTSNNDRHHKY